MRTKHCTRHDGSVETFHPAADADIYGHPGASCERHTAWRCYEVGDYADDGAASCGWTSAPGVGAMVVAAAGGVAVLLARPLLRALVSSLSPRA